MKTTYLGPLLIACAAMLWATDALFRFPTVTSLDPTFVVFAEHLIDLIFLLPWVLLKHRKHLFKLNALEWVSAVVIGVGGSAIASVFFTASFKYLNPSVVILLQKLQPVIVVLLAFIFLNERPRISFYGWALVSIFAGILLSFPDLRFDFNGDSVSLKSRGVIYALISASLWAVSTVAGKVLLKKRSPSVVTFWRFCFGFGALSTLLVLSKSSVPLSVVTQPHIAQALLYMGLIPGLIAMISYYGGLEKTQASIATFVELLFPVSAILLNTIFLKTPLSLTQVLAGLVLLFSVTMISFSAQKTKKKSLIKQLVT